jgi:hypothetical protein
MSAHHPALARAVTSPWVIPALLIVAGGAAAGVIRSYAGAGHEPESDLADVAFAAPVVMAGLVALAGVQWRRQGMVVGSAFAVYPIAIVSIVMWPLVIPASFLVVHGFTLKGAGEPLHLAGTVLLAAGLPVAFFALLVHEDPVAWQTAFGSGSSSDVVTNVEAVLSLSITAVAGLAATALLTTGEGRKGTPA